VGLFPAEEVAHQLLHFRDARRAAYQPPLPGCRSATSRIFQRLLSPVHRAFQQVIHHLFEPRARELLFM